MARVTKKHQPGEPIQGAKSIYQVHDIDAGLRDQHIERVHIVHLCVGNMDKSGMLPRRSSSVCIFTAALVDGNAPMEQRQAQIDAGRIQRVNRAVQIPQQTFALA